MNWFAAEARDLPWRRTRDPYAIWVSEIMLQQTQVNTVIPYWERWLRELPTIADAAKAPSAKLHKLWEGLGYYTRVRNLQKAAQAIVQRHGGEFPDDYADVLELPGIGRYTAGAICSIAFNQPTPILDGNVIRVLTRLFGIAENPKEKATNARLWALAEELVTQASSSRGRAAQARLGTSARAGDHGCSHLNQSLMELGALVCTPRNPQCPFCPVRRLCAAFRENRVDSLPNLGRREPATARRFAAFILERDGKFLVRQRPAGEVNAHLWEFPNVELGTPVPTPSRRSRRIAEAQRDGNIPKAEGHPNSASLPGVAVTPPAPEDPHLPANGLAEPARASVSAAAQALLGLAAVDLTPLLTVKHSITRYRITLEGFRVDAGQANPPAHAGVWKTPAQMRRLAFTSAHRRILRKAVQRASRPRID